MCLSPLACHRPPFVNPKTSVEQLRVDTVAPLGGGGSKFLQMGS